MHDAFLYNAADVLKSIKDPATRQSVEETTLIYQLFGGRLLSHVRCTECGHVSKTLETFLDLNLDLSSLAASIEEALTNFCKYVYRLDIKCIQLTTWNLKNWGIA